MNVDIHVLLPQFHSECAQENAGSSVIIYHRFHATVQKMLILWYKVRTYPNHPFHI